MSVMEQQKWYTIPKYPNYEINESLEVRHKDLKRIKKFYLDDGYKKTNLQFNGKKDKPYLHQIVAWVFVPNPENKPEVHHIDENKLNNHWSNLMWVTKQEHRRISAENEQTSFKISRKDVVFIRDNYSEDAIPELAKRFGVAHKTIYGIAIRSLRGNIEGGRINEPFGLYKKIVNIDTGQVYESAEKLSAITGIKSKEIRRRLSGERYNTTPFRYVGMETVCVLPPPIPKSPIAVFDLNWNLIKQFEYISDASSFIGAKDNNNIYEFLRGKFSHTKGYKFKRIAPDGSYIEPIPFVSKKPPLKPKRIKAPVTPSKPILQCTKDGGIVRQFDSIGQAAKAVNTDKKNLKKVVNGKRSSTGYCKGFIWKYA